MASTTDAAPRRHCRQTCLRRSTSARSFCRLERGSLVACEPDAAQITTYASPTPDGIARLSVSWAMLAI
jgi:hypothetical protein